MSSEVPLPAFMRRDLADERRWITRQHYLDGISERWLIGGAGPAGLLIANG